MSLLTSSPNAAEILADRVKPLRLAEANGGYDVFFPTGKRRKVLDDPELFAAYHLLAVETRGVVEGHVEALVAQVTTIITDGQASGEFALSDPAAAARAVLNATARLHHPVHASDWASPTIDAEFESVWSLVLRGLRA